MLVLPGECKLYIIAHDKQESLRSEIKVIKSQSDEGHNIKYSWQDARGDITRWILLVEHYIYVYTQSMHNIPSTIDGIYRVMLYVFLKYAVEKENSRQFFRDLQCCQTE